MIIKLEVKIDTPNGSKIGYIDISNSGINSTISLVVDKKEKFIISVFNDELISAIKAIESQYNYYKGELTDG